MSHDLRRWIALVEMPEVWHGSPHDFDRFDTTRIGSGEGNRTFGWGLYFATQREVAEYYRNSLADRSGVISLNGKPIYTPVIGLAAPYDTAPPPVRIAISRLYELGGTLDQAIAALRDRANQSRQRADPMGEKFAAVYDEAATWLETNRTHLSTGRGNVYHVAIPDEDAYMDWDMPLDEQPAKVQEALAASGLLQRFLDDPQARPGFHSRDFPAAGFYRWLARDDYGGQTNARDASLKLAHYGIVGIRYYDAHSRDEGGTFNYVVFDDKHVRMKGRYA
jgi:hypothetical protein